jgi:hypothetical protein
VVLICLLCLSVPGASCHMCMCVVGVALGYAMYLSISLVTGEFLENLLDMCILYVPSLEALFERVAFLRPFLPKQAGDDDEDDYMYDDAVVENTAANAAIAAAAAEAEAAAAAAGISGVGAGLGAVSEDASLLGGGTSSAAGASAASGAVGSGTQLCRKWSVESMNAAARGAGLGGAGGPGGGAGGGAGVRRLSWATVAPNQRGAAVVPPEDGGDGAAGAGAGMLGMVPQIRSIVVMDSVDMNPAMAFVAKDPKIRRRNRRESLSEAQGGAGGAGGGSEGSASPERQGGYSPVNHTRASMGSLLFPDAVDAEEEEGVGGF